MVKSTPIFDHTVVREFINMSKDLIPIEKSSTWKGRTVDFSEAVRRKFNQIINLFKTGTWRVERQAAVKIKRDLHKITTMVDEKTLATTDPSKLQTDFEMRQQLANRLRYMREIFNIAKGRSERPEKIFQDLENELNYAIKRNENILKEENKLISRVQVGKEVFEGVAEAARSPEWRERVEKREQERVAEKRADELIGAERPKKRPKTPFEQKVRTLDEALKRKHGEEGQVVGKARAKQAKTEKEALEFAEKVGLSNEAKRLRVKRTGTTGKKKPEYLLESKTIKERARPTGRRSPTRFTEEGRKAARRRNIETMKDHYDKL